MHNPLAPLVAIAQRGIPFTASAPSASAPSTLSSVARKPRPTTTARAIASPLAVASDAVVAAACPPRLMLFPAPGPRRGDGRVPAHSHPDPHQQPYPIETEALTKIHPKQRAP